MDQRRILLPGAVRARPAVARQRARRAPLERLAAEGELRAYRHDGFWDCMDTYKDAVVLNDLLVTGGGALEAVGATV